ncbi:MAG: kelch repeat-containing protein [Hyalangium sp.]|uniref:Kelch repeat-containing protein n=1 Tax=Hyalangium sp. TaxID=2028555 RepID=UPI00389984C1
MNAVSPRLWLVLGLALLAGCSASSTTGTAQFAVSVPQTLSSTISRVSVTSSAADIPSISVDLAFTHGVWGGIIGNIPAGPNRSFLARAFDSSGALLFEGSASGVTISADQITLVAITLQEINAPPPFQNEAPLIDSLVASSTSVPTGGAVSLVATAHDPNTGDSLTYSWSSTGGTFSSASSTSTSWTAPTSVGIQTLTFTVTDSQGLSSSISLAINVLQGGGQGDAQLSITFNSSPRVASLSASPSRFAVGETASVSVTASDPDGDSLSYSWSATCAGSWAQASSSAAQFTPTALPSGACNNCNLTVTVTDGRGGQTTGTVALCVSNTPPINHLNPVIIRSYRSSDTAAAGEVLTYEVVASDPESSTLSFSWAASAGTLGSAANGSSNSRITWTAPSCVSTSTPPTLTATATNAFNLTATRSFSVAGLPACATSGWASTGPMASARFGHTSTLLPNGKVLVAGGGNDYFIAPEVYDPSLGTWSTVGSPVSIGTWATATLLPNGKVLVAGGDQPSTAPLPAAWLYDAASGTWSDTTSMASQRSRHTATLLPNGKVLVAGGGNYYVRSPIATAELYDAASGTWSAASSMASPRAEHTATLLPNGKILVVGGYNNVSVLATAELYDPASGTWSAAASMTSPRWSHTATLLPNGKVLVTGGSDGRSVATATLYDPSSNTWSDAAPMSTPRWGHTATLLPNGKVLVAGGEDSFLPWPSSIVATAELYDPASDTWTTTATMASVRSEYPATLLPNGKVLVTGGFTFSFLSSAELYTP